MGLRNIRDKAVSIDKSMRRFDRRGSNGLYDVLMARRRLRQHLLDLAVRSHLTTHLRPPLLFLQTGAQGGGGAARAHARTRTDKQANKRSAAAVKYMFRNTFQSGFLSIVYSLGNKPLQLWDKHGAWRLRIGSSCGDWS